MTFMKLSAKYGAIVTSSGRDKQPFYAGTPLGISLDIGDDVQTKPISIRVTAGAKYVLNSVTIKAPFFGPDDQIMLMARFIKEAVENQHNEWICLSNFLGKRKGGQSLPNSSQFYLEAVGPCVVELAAPGSLKNGSVEVVGNLVAFGGVPPSRDTCPNEGEFTANEPSLSSKGRVVRVLIKSIRAQAIVVGLMILGLARYGGGGFTQSSPSLHPTNHKNLHAGRNTNRHHGWNSKAAFAKLASGVANPPSDSASQNRLSFLTERGIGDRSRNFLASMNQEHSEAIPARIPVRDIEASLDMTGHTNAELPSVMSPQVSQATSHVFSEGTHAQFISELRALSEECVNLTIAIILFPFEGSVGWSLDAITPDGNTTVWSRYYSDPNLALTIIIEHSQENDSNGEPFCLAPGKYRLSPFPTLFIVSSEGTFVECGSEGIFVLPFNSSDPSTQSNNDDDWGGLDLCPNITCSDDYEEGDCINKAMGPARCFLLEWERYHRNRTMWLTDYCARIFDDICQSISLGVDHDYIGFDLQTNFEDICPFFECAYPAYQSYMKGGTLKEYHGCNCLHELVFNADSLSAKCCLGGSSENSIESELAKSCSCIIEPSCNNGNVEMCSIALEFCCPEKLDSEGQTACKQSALHVLCRDSIKNNNTSEDSFCHQESSVKCDDDKDAYGCKCSYWETLYTENTRYGFLWEEAVEYCCVGYFSQIQCRCDFYNYALKFGYVSDQKDSSCYLASEGKSYQYVESEQYELQRIAGSLGIEWWFNNDGWQDNKTSHCDWFGVTCNAEGFVSRINLKGNNLTGKVTDKSNDGAPLFLGDFLSLEMLDLSDNSIFGSIHSWDNFNLRQLLHVDLSQNDLKGVVDILLSPSIRYLNFSHNYFTSVGYIMRSYLAYESIEVIDISHNRIKQRASAVFRDLPPNLKGLYVSDNFIAGTFPNPFPAATRLEHFHVARNHLTGPLIWFSHSMPRVITMDLSNQKYSGGRGLNGSLPSDLQSLSDLSELDLSGNRLTSTIPSGLANIPRLLSLNLSNNALEGKIPSDLGQLAAVLKVIDLSSNAFTGTIPQELKDFKGLVLLNINRLWAPAPLGLCYNVPGFDLKKHSGFCPPERNALNDFFISARGLEWTNSSLWGDQFASPCSWKGIKCSESTSKVVELDLSNNGLSGFLNESVGSITSLRILDLNDNNLKGLIPSELFLLSSLTSLRLSYNQFSGTVPIQLAHLTDLELVQFHSNWLTGEIHLNAQLRKHNSSFTSDCGVPSDFDKPIVCENCTMCCNRRGECQSTERPMVLTENTQGLYRQLSRILLLSIFVFFVLLVPTSYSVNKHFKACSLTGTVSGELIEEEKHYALNAMGRDTVYSFFLTKFWTAWMVSLSVIAFQFAVFRYFVSAAEMNFEDEKSDFVYAWRCPRNIPVCKNDDDRTWGGWLIFGVLMATHLLKDLINGSKLVLMSTKTWHHWHWRIRFFCGGMSLILITTYAIYASTVYNSAIARTNSGLVANAVIILFITDVDEQIFSLLEAMSPPWLENLKATITAQHDEPENESHNARPCEKLDFAEKTDKSDRLSHQGADIDASLQHMPLEMTVRIEQMGQSNAEIL